jgi:hypothetical protein
VSILKASLLGTVVCGYDARYTSLAEARPDGDHIGYDVVLLPQVMSCADN